MSIRVKVIDENHKLHGQSGTFVESVKLNVGYAYKVVMDNRVVTFFFKKGQLEKIDDDR